MSDAFLSDSSQPNSNQDQAALHLFSGYIDLSSLPRSAAPEAQGQGQIAGYDKNSQNTETGSGYIDMYALPHLAARAAQTRGRLANSADTAKSPLSSESIDIPNLFPTQRWNTGQAHPGGRQSADKLLAPGQSADGKPVASGKGTDGKLVATGQSADDKPVASDKSADNKANAPSAEFGPGRQYLYNRSGEPLYGGALERKLHGNTTGGHGDSSAAKKPMELPFLRTLGDNASDVWSDDKAHPDRVTEVSNGFAKNRILFGYDQKNDLESVTKSSLGKEATVFRRESGTDNWYSQAGGEKVYLPGKVEVRKNGDLAIEQKDGSLKIEEPSGAERFEHTLPNHTKIDLNGDGTVNGIKRPDGSEARCQHNNGKLTEVDETGPKPDQSRTWTQQEGGLWTSSDKSEKPRRDLQVTPDGKVTFKDESGLTRSLLSGGETITTGQGHSGTTFDNQGQLSKYIYPDGSGSRGFERDDHGKVNKFTECDASGKVNRTFTRDGDKSTWNVTDKDGKSGGTWQGEIVTDSAGGWSSISLAPGTKPEDLRWTRMDEKGNPTYVKTMDGGINLTSDVKDNLTDVSRANDTTAQCEYKDGKPIKITTTNKPGGEALTFTHDDKNNVWHCDNPKIADSLKSPLSSDGKVSYKTTDGNTVTVKLDGTQEIAKADGSYVEIDRNGFPSKARGYDGSTREFQYRDGKLTGYADTINGKTESHSIDAIDKNSYRVTETGDLEIHDAKDGTKRVNTSNLDLVEYNKSDLPTRVHAHNGSTRDIQYLPGSRDISTITDTRQGANGQIVTSKLEHQTDFPQGSLAQIDTAKDGTPELKNPRFHVQLDDHGNYSYTNQKGEARLSRAGDQLVKPGEAFNSPDIDQARAGFRDTMQEAFHGDEKRVERMDEMMTKFEKRMANTVERRVAAGEDEKTVQQQVENKVAETYRQLNRMASAPDGGTFDDKATRANFAETFMYHAFWPQSVTQQGWNSCWNQSQWIISLGEHPDDYAKMMADVSLTGTYTDRNKETHSYNKSDLALRDWRDGVGWSIDTATHDGSQPSPVANRIDRLVASEAGRGPLGITQGGYQQWARHAAEAITGDSAGYVGRYPNTEEQRRDMVKHGGAQRDPGLANHIANYELDKVGNDWVLVQGDQYNNRDQVVGYIPGGEKGLENWVKTGQGMVARNLSWEPSWGKEYTIKDQFAPGKVSPNNPVVAVAHNDQPHEPYRPQARVRRLFQRW